ncbi:hypothetical protein [Aquibacillus saliphilus]|uniref:hypothetical protein n=1 Tax=Aquibacillus saliphilus TaxID=1909422 RepID=UPI001CF0470B|nr:hypothetical protein [Aquibacillus saliphilus]
MKNKLFILLTLSFLFFVLTACTEKEEVENEPASAETEEPENPEESEEPVVSEEVEPTGEVVEVTITATNFEFDIKEIKANVGDTILLTLEDGSGGHGIGIDEFNVDVSGGNTVEFVVDESGEFQYYCNLVCGVGHDKMIGTLIVS